MSFGKMEKRFLYCPFCIFGCGDYDCGLQHSEFDQKNECTGRIVFDISRRGTLICDACQTIIPKPFEMGTCDKFHRDPFITIEELLSPRSLRETVVRRRIKVERR